MWPETSREDSFAAAAPGRGAHVERHVRAPRRGPRRGSRLDAAGAGLVEVMVVMGLLVVLVGLAIPSLPGSRDAWRLDGAVTFLHGRIMLARSDAARRGATVGIRVRDQAGAMVLASYVDGNGDGIRTADIARGIDSPLGPDVRFGDRFPGVTFARGPTVPPLGGGDPRPDAIRLGQSDILSVTPLGTATSGTIYLRSRRGRQAAVRVLGATARLQVHEFDYHTGRWRQR